VKTAATSPQIHIHTHTDVYSGGSLALPPPSSHPNLSDNRLFMTSSSLLYLEFSAVETAHPDHITVEQYLTLRNL